MSKGQKNKVSMREQLLKKKEHGEKYVEWKLSPKQLSFVQDEMHMTAVPILYEISTKRVLSAQHHILKTVSTAFKNGRKKLYVRLADYEIKALAEAGVQFNPYKYRIDLVSVQ